VLRETESELGDEERVACGQLVDRRREPRLRRRADASFDDRGRVGQAERPEPNPDRARIPDECVEHDRIDAPRRVVAPGHEQRHTADVVELEREGGEGAQGLAVAAIDVVDGDQNRTLGGKPALEPGELPGSGARIDAGRSTKPPNKRGWLQLLARERACREDQHVHFVSPPLSLPEQATFPDSGRTLDRD